MFSRFISVIQQALLLLFFPLILPLRLLPFALTHSLFRFFYYDIQNRVGARIYNIHIVIIGLDFDMVCAPYTLNNLYLSFEFVVFFVFHFLGGSFIQHFSIIHTWIMMEVGEPNKTQHIVRCERKEKRTIVRVCVRESLCTILLCIFLVLAVCLFRFVIYNIMLECMSVCVSYIHIAWVEFINFIKCSELLLGNRT